MVKLWKSFVIICIWRNNDMKKMRIAMAMLLALALLPGMARAATAGNFTITLTGGGEPADGTDYSYSSGVLTILSNTPMRIPSS